MDVTLPPPSSSSLEYQFPESPRTEGQTCCGVSAGVHSLLENTFQFCAELWIKCIPVIYSVATEVKTFFSLPFMLLPTGINNHNIFTVK